MIADLIFFIVLLFLSAFFSASETAFTSLSLLQVENLEKKKGRKGKLIKSFYEKPDIFISTVLVCNNLVNVSMSAIATNYTIKMWGSDILGYVTGILTLIILIFGEVTPKNIAITWNESIILAASPVIWILSAVFRPVIAVINFCGTSITKIFRGNKKEKVSVEMIYNLISYASNLNIVKDYEKKMVKGVFSLGHNSLKEIMTHRTDVFSLDQEKTISQIIKAVNKNSFYRIPVYSGNPENITGIVLISHIMREIQNGRFDTKLKAIKMEPFFIPESKKISEVFRMLKNNRICLAVVLDEYGGLAGIVTMQDIIEEILGEIYDENYELETEKIEKLPDGDFIIAGEASLSEVNEKLGISLPEESGTRTISGFIIKNLDHIPLAGEKVKTGGSTFIIEKASDKQILSIRFHIPKADQQGS